MKNPTINTKYRRSPNRQKFISSRLPLLPLWYPLYLEYNSLSVYNNSQTQLPNPSSIGIYSLTDIYIEYTVYNSTISKMVALDVEQSAPMLRRRYYENDPSSNRLSSLPQPPPGLPPRHPLNILKRCSIIGGILYALYGEFFCMFGTAILYYILYYIISSILLCSLLHIFTPHTLL